MFQPLSIVADQQLFFVKEILSDFADITLANGRLINQEMIKNATILLVRSTTKIDKTLLENSSVRFIGSATSGIDHVDLAYLESVNIHFVHAPGSNARSVAEYVLSSLLAVAELQEFSLLEKTVGIIGCGRIGSLLRKFLEVLGVQCLVNDPPLAQKTGDPVYLELEAVLTADIISLHVPLCTNGEFPTQNLINKKVLSQLKKETILINTARGEVINEADVIAFKKNNPAFTLILDVWCNEPTINRALLQQTLLATPHIAGYSLDGKLNAMRMLLEELIRFTDIKLDLTHFDFLDQKQQILELENDIIQLAIMQGYDVRNDAAPLRRLVTIGEKKGAAYFDALRKYYPVRREFSSKLIQANHLDDETAEKLRQLNFKVNRA